MTTVVLEIVVWDDAQTEALIRKIASDPRVVGVTEISK